MARSTAAVSLLLLLPLQGELIPPGLLEIAGGPTTIGEKPEKIQALVLAREDLATALGCETPQHTLEVPRFFLMPTEVTNEQYWHYVRSTGGRPPRSWGTRALQAGQLAFLEAQGRAKLGARAEGKPFEGSIFDPAEWWEKNWRRSSWDVPEDELALPVTCVSYAEARAYAHWAGLRLMDEFEFKRAGSENTARTYPWGEDWNDKKYCRSLHSGVDRAAPVGSFPAGAVNGIHDLAGNVWEWTSSPFVAFPGHAALRVVTRSHTIELVSPFDPDQRVAVSGSYQTDKVGVRLSTRRNTDRSQATSALGFRCAASPKAGLDPARWLIEDELSSSVLAGHAVDPQAAFLLRRWSTARTRVGVPGYAVISGYQQVLGCPLRSVEAATPGELAKLSRSSGPVLIGFVEVPCPLTRPELDAGAYFVAWRGQGEPEPGSTARLPYRDVPGFSPTHECFLLYTADGTPQVALDAAPVASGRPGPGSVRVEPCAPRDKRGAGREAALDTLRFSFVLPTARSPSKALIFELALGVTPGAIDATWK